MLGAVASAQSLTAETVDVANLDRTNPSTATFTCWGFVTEDDGRKYNCVGNTDAITAAFLPARGTECSSMVREYVGDRTGLQILCDGDGDPGPGRWYQSGSGPQVLSIPDHVQTVRITGHNQGGTSENFVVWCGRDTYSDRGGLWVNEILSVGQRYEVVVFNEREYNGAGSPCRHVTVKHSVGVRWTLTEWAVAQQELVSRRAVAIPELDELDVLQSRRLVLDELLRLPRGRD